MPEAAEPYRLKSMAVLASGPGVLVRQFVFAKGEATPWHRHSAMEDRCYVLAGQVAVETRGPPGRADLAAGDSHVVAAGVIHRIVNTGDADARLVLVQHGGRYDFLAEPDGGPGRATE